jgi:hypothetical protein
MRKLMPMGTVVGLAMAWVMPLPAGAVESDDFLAATTEDMVALCTASPDEAMADQAVHFCHGYLIGAFQYYQQLVAGPEADPFVCLPDPPPSRDEGGRDVRFVGAGAPPVHGRAAGRDVFPLPRRDLAVSGLTSGPLKPA